MTPTTTEQQEARDIIERASKLPPAPRESIAHELLDEMEIGGVAPPAPEHVRLAWKEEIARRIAAYQRGEMKTLTVEETLAQLDAALAEERQNASRNRS